MKCTAANHNRTSNATTPRQCIAHTGKISFYRLLTYDNHLDPPFLALGYRTIYRYYDSSIPKSGIHTHVYELLISLTKKHAIALSICEFEKYRDFLVFLPIVKLLDSVILIYKRVMVAVRSWDFPWKLVLL